MADSVIEIPGMKFRGLKVYLESQSDKDDKLNVERFTNFIEHYTGNQIKSNSFYYHLKARRTLGII